MAIKPIEGFYVHDEETNTDGVAKVSIDAVHEFVEDVSGAVVNWLDEHPEATTTVEDGAITDTKLNGEFLQTVKNAYVTPEMFGAKGDGETDDTLAVQSALDSDYDVILNGEYNLRKQTELNYSNDEEPCLVLRKPKKVSGTGTLITNIHGLTCLEVNEDNCEIEGITIRGYGLFPDVGSSGRGEKSTPGQGWYDGNHSSYQFSLYRNNSVDTSGWSGFEGSSRTWGTFGGGFIGNCGSGIWVFDCRDVFIHNVAVSGFNFDGITIGIRRSATTQNVTVSNCVIEDCYCGGIETYNAQHIVVCNNYIKRIGHPSVIANPGNYTYVDPGYGIAFGTWQASSGDDYRISKYCKAYCNKVEDAVRNALDVHGGEYITFANNYGLRSYGFACEVGSYSGTGQSCNIECINNEFIDCNPISFRNTETFTNSKASNWKVNGNKLKLPSIKQYPSYGAIDCIRAGAGGVEVKYNNVSNVTSGKMCTYVNADNSTIEGNIYNTGILAFYIPHGIVKGNTGYATYRSYSSQWWLSPIYLDGKTAESDSKYVRMGETESIEFTTYNQAISDLKGTPFVTPVAFQSGASMAYFETKVPRDHIQIVSASGCNFGYRVNDIRWTTLSDGKVGIYCGLSSGGAVVDASAGHLCRWAIEFKLVE